MVMDADYSCSSGAEFEGYFAEHKLDRWEVIRFLAKRWGIPMSDGCVRAVLERAYTEYHGHRSMGTPEVRNRIAEDIRALKDDDERGIPFYVRRKYYEYYELPHIQGSVTD